jgi:hypothetical protein
MQSQVDSLDKHDLARADTGFDSIDKGKVDQRETVARPVVDTIQEDDDQVGYAAFKESQALGYEPVSVWIAAGV